jgi:hypothetical protein
LLAASRVARSSASLTMPLVLSTVTNAESSGDTTRAPRSSSVSVPRTPSTVALPDSSAVFT